MSCVVLERAVFDTRRKLRVCESDIQGQNAEVSA
jgi:hypothetical protein